MKLRSSAFKHGELIPIRNTKQGENFSPPLKWYEAPAETKEFALLVENMDVKVEGEPFVHWLIYKIQHHVRELEEDLNVQADDSGASLESLEGTNSFGVRLYEGPRFPPRNATHRISFKLFALDSPLNMSVGATRAEFLNSIKNTILDSAELTGVFYGELTSLTIPEKK